MTPAQEPSSADAARARAREQVRSALAGAREAHERACPHCGRRARTLSETCPACGRSYFTRPARLSARRRRALLAVVAVLGVAAAVTFAVVYRHQGRRNELRAQDRRARAVAAERRRLALEQRPHHARLRVADPGAPARGVTRRAVRRSMVSALESAITADARARVRAGTLAAHDIGATACRSLVNGAPGDELDLDKPLGRYSCVAIIGAPGGRRSASTLGIPFVGTIGFGTGRLTWCKDNPVSAGDVTAVYAFVRLARECTAARGPAFGSGYLIEPRR